MNGDLKIAILSRNEIVREGLRRILKDQDFTVAQVSSEAATLCANEDLASIVVIDAIGFDEGLASCQEIRELRPEVRTVLMVDEYDIDHVIKAFATGAVDGYLVKAISCEPLAGALRLVAMGEKVLPSQVVEAFMDPATHQHPPSWDLNCTGLNLSAREVEILRCLVDGDANKLISRRLHIADATVKVHIKAILRKLRVKNRTQAAIWAVSRGLASDSSRPAVSSPALQARPEMTMHAAVTH